jgi:hypothetical protein
MKTSLLVPVTPKTPGAARKRLWLMVCLVCLLAFDAGAQLKVRVSVKVVLDLLGNRPAGGNLSTDEGIRNSITNANRKLAGFGRGYQMNLIEIRDLPFHAELELMTECDAVGSIKAGIKNDPASYLWVPDAMNIYVNAGISGHGCSGGYADPIVMLYTDNIGLHEPGHFFHVCHTQGCGCAWCDTCPLVQDDGIDDTLWDRACWSQDEIALYNYALPYAQLMPAQQILVSNTFNNVMSYHGTNGGNAMVLTSGQLDRMADTANRYVSSNIVNGFTHFVDRTNACAVPTGSSACLITVGGPFPTVAGGIASASPGDIVLVRVGHYNEPMTIRKAITLRATRGNALLGKP